MMKRALVLSGGGEKGGYQAGAAWCLINEQGREYDSFHGVSVGAINSFKLAECHDGETLARVWKTISNNKVWKSWWLGWLSGLFEGGLRNSEPLEKLLHESVDVDKLRLSKWELYIGAVDLTTGRYEVLTKDYPDIVGAVMASGAHPVVLPPVMLRAVDSDEMHWWSDGGVRNVTPVRSAVRAGADEIDVVMCSTAGGVGRWNVRGTPNVLDRSLRELDIVLDEAAADDIKWTNHINALVAAGQKPDKREVKIKVIRPRTPIDSDLMDFDPEKIEGMIQRGYDDARDAFKE
jgi:predicted acylesterase/phospholipase RssA